MNSPFSLLIKTLKKSNTAKKETAILTFNTAKKNSNRKNITTRIKGNDNSRKKEKKSEEMKEQK